MLREDFQKVIVRLAESLALKKSDIVRDSAIKRFELCFDLAWKAIKAEAKRQGLECFFPRECFKMAFQLKLIDYDERWLEMIEDRNLTTYLYSEKDADEIFTHLRRYLEMFKKLSDGLEQIE